MAADGVQAIAIEFEKTKSVHAACNATTLENIDVLLRNIESARTEIESGGSDPRSCLENLQRAIRESKLEKQIANDQKDAFNALQKAGKITDTAFPMDICKSSKPTLIRQAEVNRTIAQHLFRQGRVALGRTFIREAALNITPEMIEPFMEMNLVIEALKQEDLTPALQWVNAHMSQLAGRGQALAFKIHRQYFVGLLLRTQVTEALAYAQVQLAPFAKTQMRAIQRLMGALLYVNRLEASPYKEFTSPEMWIDLRRSFTKEACLLLGLSYQSPLFTCVMAGNVALPILIKTAALMQGRFAPDPSSVLDIDLGASFQFHSLFTCPVSREQSSEENPPVMLLCGHVLCKQSVQKLAKGNSKFKCPYCPCEQLPSQARQLHL